ncbi:PelD GGDEF domain-containing protein [Paraburkholderia acidisoli]|uniref:Sugar ABC transporter permease n=1 Tax=Paraburkholderia acidisoli TaxID=2571748 RepID=A0A7Z2JF74_9BURK|nr:PelD GGDEF domain-containing protein [Paraburkholderia acidisoli]QGZ63112.1 sugar ABC transporter permease [Paraburkholderia acidisoli]
MNTRSTDDAAARTRLRRRQQQSVPGGSRWARFVAPPKGVVRRRTIALVETLVATLVVLALGMAFDRADPLFMHSGFGWIWIVPVVIALRYGSIVGACSGLVLLGGWFVLYPGVAVPHPGLGAAALATLDREASFPVDFFFGGFVLTLLCGQFGDIWTTRLRQARVSHDYLSERLSILMRNQYMLRLSHERLEQDLMSRPATLRDTLVRLREFAFAQDATPAQQGDVALVGAQAFLDTAAQACQFDTARIYAWRGGHPAKVAAASIGPAFELDEHDSLLREALETRSLVHVASAENQHAAHSAYLACVPLVDAFDNPIGLLVVKRMPFLALTLENLQFLLVLCHFYADGVRHASVTRGMLAAFPACPYEFALDYARLVHLARESQVSSSLVALVFENDERSQPWFQHVLRTRRALDAQWALHTDQHLAMLTLMPLSGEGAIDGYLRRIEETLQAQYGVTFESARVAVYSMPVPDHAEVDALRRLLERCNVGA